MKKIFRFEDYQGDYVMNCKTREEANEFCQLMHDNERTWLSGESYLESNKYYYFKEDTLYYFNEGTFGDLKENYTILKWSDFTNTPQTEQESNSDEETETLKDKLERLIKLEKRQKELENEIQSIRNMRYELLCGNLTDKFI